jgi:hypothetical protein
MSEISISFRVMVEGNFINAALPVADKRNILTQKLADFEGDIEEEVDNLIGDDIGGVLNGYEMEFRFIHAIAVQDAAQQFNTTTKVLIDISTDDIVSPEIEEQVNQILRDNLNGLADNLAELHHFDGTDVHVGRHAGEGDEDFTGYGAISTVFGAQNGGRRRGRRSVTKKRRVANQKRRASKKTRKSLKKRRVVSHKRSTTKRRA